MMMQKEKTESERRHDRASMIQIARQWFIVLGPLLAAFTQQQVSYIMVSQACRSGLLLLVLPALFAFAVIGWAAYLANQDLTRHREGTANLEASEPETSRFFALVGLALAAISLVVWLALWLPALFLPPCVP